MVVGGETFVDEVLDSTEYATILGEDQVADFKTGPFLPVSGIKEAQLLALPAHADKSDKSAMSCNPEKHENLSETLDNQAELQYAITNGLLLIGGMDKYSNKLSTIYRLESISGNWEKSDKLSLQTPRHRHISFLVTYESLVCKE